MERRVFGLETEFGVSWRPPASAVHADLVLQTLAAAAPVDGLHGFLVNGGRLYADCGHVEYSTAETCDPHDAVVNDRAGEVMVASLAGRAKDQLYRWAVFDVRHYKHSTDGKGHAYGCHENYLVDAAVPATEAAQLAGAFLLTRGVWAGAGRWDGTAYYLTQRGWALASVTGPSSTRNRPLVHLKNEPLADPTRWYRLHVLAGDANMSDVVTHLKLATTHLVLRCVEEAPARWRELQPAEFRAAADAVDADLSGRGRYRTEGGRYVSALDVQRWYHARAGRLLDARGGSLWERDAHLRWGELLDALEVDGPGGLVGVADWATKLDLLERVAGRSGGMASPKVAYAEMAYHEVNDGYARRLEAAGHLERLTSDAEVEAAVRVPPATRAEVRAEFVRAAGAHRDLAPGVAWDQLRLGGRSVRLGDPFSTDLSVLERVGVDLGAAATR